ncbi:hypothetical protein [Aromatoleum petrolei]|uniref:hypothetical protein n=1 Tax=Aromatoleum petrolei TaxID=76116 RepID=UPI001AEC6476
MLDRLEPWLVSRLGKGVARAKDAPSFVANRIGVMWLLDVERQQFVALARGPGTPARIRNMLDSGEPLRN